MATIFGGGSSNDLNMGSLDVNNLAQQLGKVINDQLASGGLTRSSSPTSNPTTGSGLAVISEAGGATTVAPADTTVLVGTGGGSATVYGSGGSNQQVLIDNTNTSYNTAGGSGSVYAGDGNDSITVPLNSGTFDIQVGAGNDTVNVLGGSSTVQAGAGTDLFNVGSPGLTTGNFLIMHGTSGSVIGAGFGTDTVFGSTGPLFIQPNSRNVLYYGDSGSATVQGGAGSDTLVGGTGADYLVGGAKGMNIIITGMGSVGSTVFGGGSFDLLVARGSANNMISAGAGNETLTGSYNGSVASGNNSFFSGAGADTITAGAGNDSIYTGGGSATVNMGAGKDVLIAASGHTGGAGSIITVNNFVSGQDKAAFYGFAPPAITTTGASSSVTLADGTKVAFNNVVVVRSDFTTG